MYTNFALDSNTQAADGHLLIKISPNTKKYQLLATNLATMWSQTFSLCSTRSRPDGVKNEDEDGGGGRGGR